MSRVAVVVGGNKGLGYEEVKQLAQNHPDWTIMLGARSAENADAALKKMRSEDSQHSFDNVHFLQLDVTDTASIQAAVMTMKKRIAISDGGIIDFFIYNAGITGSFDVAGALACLNVNVYGLRNTVEAFIPLMRSVHHGSKVIIVSSEVGSWTLNAIAEPLKSELLNAQNLSWQQLNDIIDDYLQCVQQREQNVAPSTKYAWPEARVSYGTYGVSKVFVNAYVRRLAVERSGIHVVAVCPGYCATDLNQFRGPRPASIGGTSVIYPVDHQTQSGHFYQDGIELSYNYAMPVDHVANKNKKQ